VDPSLVATPDGRDRRVTCRFPDAVDALSCSARLDLGGPHLGRLAQQIGK
jgi:hypothetical protein